MDTTEIVKKQNKTIDLTFWKYFQNGEINKIESELFGTNYKLHFPGSPQPLNASEGKEIMKGFKNAFPDLAFTIEKQIAEGDLTATRFTVRGTHKAEFRGISPTNKKILLTGTAINRIVNNKIVERWTELNMLSLMQQIGAVPETATALHNGY